MTANLATARPEGQEKERTISQVMVSISTADVYRAERNIVASATTDASELFWEQAR